MKRNANYFVAMIAVALGLAVQTNMASADSGGLSRLSAQWWQWAISIPSLHNPLLDTSGANCMVGQHGPIWFLAGAIGGLLGSSWM